MRWQNTLRQRLLSLGYGSYKEYLRSQHWFAFRKLYFAKSYNSHRCFCGLSTVQLHHRTYERLGNERFKDVIPLCANHHGFLHKKLARHWGIGWEDDLDIDCLKIVTEEYLELAKKSRLCKPF
jgi:hypothetical protein